MSLFISRRKKTFFLMKEGIIKIQINECMNYPSGCTENLGVVPLFLLAALRTAPIFFFLFLRIILVCLVFDAMSLSCHCLFNKIRNKVLTAFKIKVKELLPIMMIFSSALPIYCAPQLASKIKHLRVGEQFSIPFTKKSQFSVGNKRVLKTRFFKSKKMLLIKGVKQGLSDLLIWEQNKSVQYQIYVSSHESQIEQQGFIDYLNYKQIKFTKKNNYLILSDPISKEELAIKSIKYCHTNIHIHCEVKLTQELQTQFKKRFQLVFSSAKTKDLECQIDGIKTICRYNSYSPMMLNEFQKQIQSDFHIRLLNKEIDSWHNYKVSFHFIEKQSSVNNSLQLGGSLLNTQLSTLLNSKPQQGAFQNPVNLKDGNVELKTIATPVFNTTLNTKNTVKIGSENSFTNSTSYSQQTQWKFAGFELEFKLFKKDNQLLLEYQTSMSTRNQDSIEGHQKSSSLIIMLNKTSNLFSIGLKSHQSSKQQLPKFSKLPIIGRLFRSNSKSKLKTELIGFLRIEALSI